MYPCSGSNRRVLSMLRHGTLRNLLGNPRPRQPAADTHTRADAVRGDGVQSNAGSLVCPDAPPPLLQERISLQTAEMDAVVDFVRARTDATAGAPPLSALPSDRRCDPVRSAVAMAVTRAATGAPAGPEVDPFVAEVLLPDASDEAAAAAASAAVLRMLPELQDPYAVGEGAAVKTGDAAGNGSAGDVAIKEEADCA